MVTITLVTKPLVTLAMWSNVEKSTSRDSTPTVTSASMAKSKTIVLLTITSELVKPSQSSVVYRVHAVDFIYRREEIRGRTVSTLAT